MTWLSDTILRLAGPLVLVAVFALPALEASTLLGIVVPGELALVLGGDASCATGGFWSALTIATTQQLPLLIYIEDNGYGISVPSEYQTPGKDIAANLASFSGLTIFNGDGTNPDEAARLVREAVHHVRSKRAPVLLRLTVPRLEGHSFQDTQGYKSEAEIEAEWARDPLPKLKAYCADYQVGDEEWERLRPDSGPNEETHPQYHLKLLLERMDVARSEVRLWRASGPSPRRCGWWPGSPCRSAGRTHLSYSDNRLLYRYQAIERQSCQSG